MAKSSIPKIVNGYAVITRTWKTGDKIETWCCRWKSSASSPTSTSRRTADPVALRYGPLIYNVERADQPNINQGHRFRNAHPRMARRPAPRRDRHQGRLGRRGSPLLAVPNFARNNRNSEGVGSMVWIKNQTTGEQANAGTLDASSFWKLKVLAGGIV